MVPSRIPSTNPEMVVMAGATPVFLKTTDKEHFKITKESLAKAITPRSKLLFMNSPGNPTGMVYTEKDLREIIDFAVEKGLYVISDEMIPETHEHGYQRAATYSLLIGFAVMLVMDFFL